MGGSWNHLVFVSCFCVWLLVYFSFCTKEKPQLFRDGSYWWWSCLHFTGSRFVGLMWTPENNHLFWLLVKLELWKHKLHEKADQFMYNMWWKSQNYFSYLIFFVSSKITVIPTYFIFMSYFQSFTAALSSELNQCCSWNIKTLTCRFVSSCAPRRSLAPTKSGPWTAWCCATR